MQFPLKIFVSILIFASGTLAWASEATVAVFEKEIRPVLKQFCYDCHGPDKAKGDIRFDHLNPDPAAGADFEIWHDVLDQLTLGEMPPPEEKQPDSSQHSLLVDWMAGALREAAEAKRFARGRVVTRRLTRYEYANTMRDLLGVNLDFAKDLPPEPASPEGFLNNGATLEMSPTQIEMYLEIARKGLAEAIVTGEQPKLHEFVQTETAQGNLPDKKVAGHEPVKPEFALDVPEFPREGEFELKITARAAIPDGQDLPRMHVSMGHVPGIIHVPRGDIGEADVTTETQTFTFRGRMENLPQPGPISFGNSGFKGMLVMIDFMDADGKELRYPDRKYVQPPPKPKKKKGNGEKEEPKPKKKPEPVPFGERLDIEVTNVEFKAPVYASWPPPSHQELVGDTELGDVRPVLKKFMTRAFRRPVSSEELAQMTQLFEQFRADSMPYEEALRETYAAVLVSPHFLYIAEKRDPDADSQPVSDYELTSRLSYFFWSSMPDERLFELAAENKLSDPEILKEEVTRMLEDERSSEFVARFVDQWLDLDALDRVAVNPEFFPEFSDDLKETMRRETHVYFEKILREDRSALELLDSDWAMLNRSLAKHYGLDGPRSSQFERVALKSESRRGGLLGQGAFLLSNANGEDSHPIKRAVWILDRLLDSPPAPPPPDVPELDAGAPDMAKLTLKEQLAVHREKESCANCHKGIDPWGVPLENYDAIGQWRTEVPAKRKAPTTKVDATSVLPNGTKIGGVDDLKRYLVEERSEWFARSVVKRMMSYALGRSLDLGDREAVETLTQEFVNDGFRMKELVHDLVQSETFRTK